jgi:hypothetical protein
MADYHRDCVRPVIASDFAVQVAGSLHLQEIAILDIEHSADKL